MLMLGVVRMFRVHDLSISILEIQVSMANLNDDGLMRGNSFDDGHCVGLSVTTSHMKEMTHSCSYLHCLMHDVVMAVIHRKSTVDVCMMAANVGTGKLSNLRLM